jgi:hypothetical protein
MLSMKLFSTPLGQLLDRARGRRRLRGVVETARLWRRTQLTTTESLPFRIRLALDGATTVQLIALCARRVDERAIA